jgi:hypothetical protein
VVANLHATMPGRFATDPDMPYPAAEMLAVLAAAVADPARPAPLVAPAGGGGGRAAAAAAAGGRLLAACDMRAVAVAAAGDPQLANAAALGYAFQARSLRRPP